MILACHYLVILQLKRYFDKKHYFFDDHNRYPEIDFQNGKIYKFPMDIQTGEKAEYSEDISYPADFIAEGLDQTRGWFRSLHVVGHAIKGENAFKNVVVNGLILAEDGKKMSKSLKNYPDPKDLIEKRGGDAFRLYTLSSPVVRAEPMRFSEKGVEQLFKDFNIPLDNVFKFFETYAKIDQWKSDGTQLFALLDQQNRESQQIQEQLVRIAPDVILVQDESLAQQLQKLASELLAKEIKIQILADASLDELLTQYAGQNLLLLASEDLIKNYREQKYGNLAHRSLNAGQVLKLPTYQLANELDRWILAELHQCLLSVDSGLQNYNLDGAIKTGIDFMEKLSNRYLRRSRRRFRENGMTSDKHSAYATIYEVLTTYLQIMAPFTPFITEHLWQKLANFTQKAEI